MQHGEDRSNPTVFLARACVYVCGPVSTRQARTYSPNSIRLPASVARCLTEGVPMVLSPFKIAGFRIHGDALSVTPMTFAYVDVVAKSAQSFDSRTSEAGFQQEHIR